MTRTLTLNATVTMPGGTITLNLTDVDLDALEGNERVLLDAFAGALALGRPGPALTVTTTGAADPTAVAAAVKDNLVGLGKKPTPKAKPAPKAKKAPAKGAPAHKGERQAAVLDLLADGPWEGTWASMLNHLGIPKGSHAAVTRRLTTTGKVTDTGGIIRLANDQGATVTNLPTQGDTDMDWARDAL